MQSVGGKSCTVYVAEFVTPISQMKDEVEDEDVNGDADTDADTEGDGVCDTEGDACVADICGWVTDRRE